MKEAAIFTTEAEFRSWFEGNLDRFGVREIVLSQEVCPDYVVIMQDGRPARIEAELFAVSFRYHRHDPKKVDYVLACYSKTQEVEGVPVIAVHKLWGFDLEPLEPLSPDAPLSQDEARLLSAIHQSGGISVSKLSEGVLAGDQQLWLRVPPDQVAAIPRGRIADSVFNVLTQSSKEWLQKYHHVLIGAGISIPGCELLESLVRRDLVEYRPIAWLSSAFDGVLIDHPAWVPTEIHATRNAWEHHKHDIMKYLWAGQVKEGHAWENA